MARSVGDLVARVSHPDAIEADLAALWRELADRTSATRALMSNLVVFRTCPPGDTADVDGCVEQLPIGEAVERHPSRVIVLVHQDDPRSLAPVAASIGVRLFGTDGSRRGVEQITIRSKCAATSLPSIVRRFVLGDLPTSVWWTEDISQAAPPAALVTMGRQFVYDSADWRDVDGGWAALEALARQPHAPDLVDLNWRRLALMRQAIALARPELDRPRAETLRIDVRHHERDRAAAWLLIGWLASSASGDVPRTVVPIVCARDSQDRGLDLTIVRESELLLSAAMSASEVTVTPAHAPAFTLRTPAENPGAGVAAALHSLGRDTALMNAIAIGRHLLTSAA